MRSLEATVVLYHCCMSLDEAKLVERDGFALDRFFRITDQLPDFTDRPADETHAIVLLAASFGFSISNYRLAYDAKYAGERLDPGSILNAFPRAIWPKRKEGKFDQGGVKTRAHR